MTLDPKGVGAALKAYNANGHLLQWGQMSEAIAAFLASRPSAIVEPAGWKLVPVEPTEEMLSAVWSLRASNGGDGSRQCYASMLAAVPPSPQPHTAGVTRYAMERLTGSTTLLPVVRDDGEWVKFSDVAALNAALTVEPEAPYVPQIIHFDGEGDPHWEFVERDCLTITGEVFAANVEQLFDADRNLIGFRIFDPAIAP